MADIQNQTGHRNKPKTSCFLACFGFFPKEEFSEKEESAEKISVKDGTSNITKKETSWFCWSRLRRDSFRTVPIDNTEIDFNPTSSQAKSKFKCKSKCKELYRRFIERRHPSTKTTPFQEIPEVEKASSDPKPEPKLATDPAPVPVPVPALEPAKKEILPIEKTRLVPEQNVVVENRRSFEHGESSKDETHRKPFPHHRKIESIRIGSSLPVSPDNKPKPGWNVPKFSHSASFSAPERENLAYLSTQTRVASKKSCKNDNARLNNLDPLVGLSILTVTMVIMLMCGRVLAILCTSAWLYMVPRLRPANNNDRRIPENNDEPDMNSEEYKEKVVFEGFLERDRRSGL